MALSEERRAELARKGAVEVTVQEWLGLDDVEMAIIELRIRLSREVKRRREEAGMSQKALAGRLGSAQPRVAKVEAGQIGVSLETLVSAYLATGATLSDLAALVSAAGEGLDAIRRRSEDAKRTGLGKTTTKAVNGR